ncbi:hypothetical protein D9758_012420 [Tetrapyrgos nigripes]|uniref:Uncharacterized protein n=1 Tax=Tetrapyrgos nigripes TaxID=182062 RepID=A0A8H5D773_9AGAR|nr:hypothetical protein D9758_012420 [Tetrapyrgos nigripes]
MVFLGGRSTLSRRDALLLLIGATCMHLFTTIFPLSDSSIIINTHLHHDHAVLGGVDTEPLPPPPDKIVQNGRGQGKRCYVEEE